MDNRTLTNIAKRRRPYKAIITDLNKRFDLTDVKQTKEQSCRLTSTDSERL